LGPKFVILITGVAGFIGSHLAKKFLREGHVVIGIDDLSVGFMENIGDIMDNDYFLFIKEDIRHINKIGRINSVCKIEEFMFDLWGQETFSFDIVYHLAARGETYWCQDNSDQAVDININGTLAILKLAYKYNAQHFVFADTSAEYDRSSIYPSLEKDAPTQVTPQGIYSITKMAASQFVRTWTDEKGIGSTLFRPFNIYGPSMNLVRDIPPVIGGFAKNIIKAKDCVIFGDGSKRRDFLYIDDAIDLFFAVKDKRMFSTDSETYNMGSGENYSVYEVYEIVANEILGSNKDIAGLEFQDNKPYEAQLTLADINKTRRAFNWHPKFSFASGIKKTCNAVAEKLAEVEE